MVLACGVAYCDLVAELERRALRPSIFYPVLYASFWTQEAEELVLVANVVWLSVSRIFVPLCFFFTTETRFVCLAMEGRDETVLLVTGTGTGTTTHRLCKLKRKGDVSVHVRPLFRNPITGRKLHCTISYIHRAEARASTYPSLRAVLAAIVPEYSETCGDVGACVNY